LEERGLVWLFGGGWNCYWYHGTCHRLSSHFQTQGGESLACPMKTVVEELSYFSKSDLFQIEGGKKVFILRA